MQVSAIDHVNIITDDLDGTAGFYEELLGLKRGETPGAAMGFKGAWMFDDAGNAIVHIAWKDPDRDFGGEHVPGAVTGAVHHLAFRCHGFEAAKQKVTALGLEHRVNDGMLGLRQIMLVDPNNINLELNFPGE